MVEFLKYNIENSKRELWESWKKEMDEWEGPKKRKEEDWSDI
jgi:hypothetical protein